MHQVPPAVPQRQAEEDAPGRRVLEGHPLPQEVGQADQPVAAQGNALRLREEGGVGVDPLLSLPLHQIRRQVVQKPAGEGAGGGHAAGVGIQAVQGIVPRPPAGVLPQDIGHGGEEGRGPVHQHGVPGLHHAHADRLGSGVRGAADHGRALRQAGFRGGGGRDAPDDGIGALRDGGQLLPGAHQAAALLVPGHRGGVEHGTGAPGGVLVHVIFAGQAGREKAGGDGEVAGPLVDLRLVFLDPENLRAEMLYTEGTARPLDPLGAQRPVEGLRLGDAAGVDAVEDGVAQGGAMRIHRGDGRHDGADPHGGDLPGGHAGLGQQLLNRRFEGLPPVLDGIVLREAGGRRAQLVGLRRHGDHPALEIAEDALGLVGADVKTK